MVRNAVVTFSGGKLEVPKEVQDEMRLTDGARAAAGFFFEHRISCEDGRRSAEGLGSER